MKSNTVKAMTAAQLEAQKATIAKNAGRRRKAAPLSAKASPSKKSAPAVTDSVNTTFTLAKETKGALRYEQEGFDESNMDATAIGTLYLRKAFFGAPYPQTIRVTVEAE